MNEITTNLYFNQLLFMYYISFEVFFFLFTLFGITGVLLVNAAYLYDYTIFGAGAGAVVVALSPTFDIC